MLRTNYEVSLKQLLSSFKYSGKKRKLCSNKKLSFKTFSRLPDFSSRSDFWFRNIFFGSELLLLVALHKKHRTAFQNILSTTATQCLGQRDHVYLNQHMSNEGRWATFCRFCALSASKKMPPSEGLSTVFWQRD